MKKIISVLLCLVFLFAFAVSCGSASGKADGGAYVEGGGDNQGIAPGTMTACARNDNVYYDMWKNEFRKGQVEYDYSASDSEIASVDRNGKLYGYVSDNWGLNSLKRVKVSVKNGEKAIPNKTITAYDEKGSPEFTAKTDNAGDAFLFPSCDKGYFTVEGVEENGELIKTKFDGENRSFEVSLAEDGANSDIIQLMFVIDATGSMGDEMEYLKVELGDVIRRVVGDSDCKIYLAFLSYRDDGDKEKFAYSDFADVTDPEKYAENSRLLTDQKATGGGDYPEALDEALELAMGKQWIDGGTKIIFHLYDAPAHTANSNKIRFKNAVVSAAEKGIRICPILASGANDLCEYLARQSAICTGGTFVWITNDSGIGGDHYDPDVKNAVVEKLNDLLVRLINGYKTGVFADPVPYNGKKTDDKTSESLNETENSGETESNGEPQSGGEEQSENLPHSGEEFSD